MHACIQAALPCLIMAQANSSPAERMPDGQTSVVELRGGTDAAMAPPVSYIQQVLLPMLQRLQGVKASIDLQRRGFFPKVCFMNKQLPKHDCFCQTCASSELLTCCLLFQARTGLASLLDYKLSCWKMCCSLRETQQSSRPAGRCCATADAESACALCLFFIFFSCQFCMVAQ